MRRRYLVFLLTAFFMLLYIGPANLLPYDAPLAIVRQHQDVQRVDPPSIVATDYNAEIAVDGDDAYYQYLSEEWTRRKNDDYMYCMNHTAPLLGWPVFRWVLNVPQGSTIDSASVSWWWDKVQQDGWGEIWLVDEANCASWEDRDASPLPTLDLTTNATLPLVNVADNSYESSDITALVQNHVDRGDFESGYYLGLMFQINATAASGAENFIQDYEETPEHYVAYINVTYSDAPSNNAPQNSATPTVSNADDSDNLYAQLREYQFTINVTDADGFADIEYTELSLWSNDRTSEYWRLRFDEDTGTFSEQSDPSNMITLNATASTNTSSGNNLNVTFYVTVHWNHTDTTDTDAKVYVRDDEAQVQYFAEDCKSFSVSPKHFPHAYYYNHRTYVVWHGEGEEEDDAGNPFIRYYDHGSGYWSDAVQIGTNLLVDDFHGSPLVWVDDEGYIHSLFGTHGTQTPMQHAKSNESESIDDGFTIISDLDWNATYPVVDYVEGVIHLIYRFYDGISQMSWIYVNSTDDGATWNTKHTFIDADDGTGVYPYRYGAAGLDPNTDDRLIMAWCIRNETEGGPEVYEDVYYAYLDLTSLHVYDIEGTDLGTFINESEMYEFNLILDTNDYGACVGSVHTDSSGVPYVMFTSEYNDGSAHQYFTYWNGSDWETPEVVCNVNKYSSVGDFILHSSTNITAFVTKGEDLHRYTWDGESWTDAETILTATSSRDLSFGFVNAPYNEEPQDEFQITFCEWWNSYENKAWGWGTNGFLNDTTDDLDFYEVNFDIETRLDFSSFSLSDGSGTVDRGDYDTIDGIVANGVVDYYGSAISPDSTEVDVWISCSDVEGGPWSDTTLTAGVFSVTVDSDNVVGLDTYSFIVVEKGEGVGGSDLSYTSHSDTYIADRLIVDIQADDETPFNEQQVNFTLTVIYDYDDTVCSSYTIVVSRNTVWWHTFINGNKTLFNDTNSDVAYVYTTYGISESTHGLTNDIANAESVTWTAATTTTTTTTTTTVTTTTETGIFYDLFLSLNMWSYLGPFALVFIGYVLTKKDKFLGVLWFVVECLFVAQYLTLIDATPGYWWHIFILLLGGLFTCVYPLLDR